MDHNYLLDENGENIIGGLLGFLNEKEAVRHPEINKTKPYAPVHTGVFTKQVNERNVMHFIPENFPTSGAGIFIFLDNNETCNGFIKKFALKMLAETYKIALIVLEPLPEGWSKCDIQREIAYANAAFRNAISRERYSLNESTYYAIGLGAGAYPATVFSILYSSVFAGLVVDGDGALHPALLEQIGNFPSDGDMGTVKKQVPLPTWIIDRHETMSQMLTYFKNSNQVEDTCTVTQTYDQYRQNIKQACTSIDGLPICEVRYSNTVQAEGIDGEIGFTQMLDFLLKRKRWLDDKNGSFRSARTPEDMQLIYYETMFDGRLRHWYVAVPPGASKPNDKGFPVVFALHGYSCTGKLFAENSQWHEVGAKRGFITVYPTAYPCVMNGSTPLPLWNCEQFEGEQGIDDVQFIMHILESVAKEYSIDRERLYVAGHSNGSGMTQQLMRKKGGTFAAFAPVGYTFGETLWQNRNHEFIQIPDDGVRRPVWLMKGEHDIGCSADMSSGTPNCEFITRMCEANGIQNASCNRYLFGNYDCYSWQNAEGVPLVRFTKVIGLPHAYTPEMAWITWDQFFSRFTRKSNGDLVYDTF